MLLVTTTTHEERTLAAPVRYRDAATGKQLGQPP